MISDTPTYEIKKGSCGGKIKKFFKKIDVYGVPVGLTYKSEP